MKYQFRGMSRRQRRLHTRIPDYEVRRNRVYEQIIEIIQTKL